jgi:hypothetical protein
LTARRLLIPSSSNRLFSQLLDKQALEQMKVFRKNYTSYGYTVSFDATSRLVLLEKLR